MIAIGLLCLLGGAFFLFVAAVGVIRFPDIYTRAHAVSKATTLGLSLALLSLPFLLPGVSLWLVLIAIIFQFSTLPVAGHLFCLAAYRRDVRGASRPLRQRAQNAQDTQDTQDAQEG